MSEQTPTPKSIEEDQDTGGFKESQPVWDMVDNGSESHLDTTEARNDESKTDEVTTSQGDTASSQAPAEEKRVHDISKAWDMAHAGKIERDTAAELRPDVQKLRSLISEDKDNILSSRNSIVADYQEKLDALNNEYSDRDESSDRQRQYQKKLDDLKTRAYNRLGDEPVGKLLSPSNTYNHQNDVLDNSWQNFTDQDNPLTESDLEDIVQDAEEPLHDFEYDADRQEEWAGILHDNAPTEAFKKQFNLEDDISAFDLHSLEISCTQDEAHARETQTRVDKILENPTVLLGNQQAVEELFRVIGHSVTGSHGFSDEARAAWHAQLSDGKQLIATAYGDKSKELIEWQSLSVDPNTTLKQLQDKYKEAVHSLIKPALTKSQVTRAVLEQIRNGNASRWQ